MRPKQAVKLLPGTALLALYALLDGSGVGMRKRWNRLKGWSER